MEAKLSENSDTELHVVKSEHMQMMPIQQAQSWYNDFVKFTKDILKSELDFGTIPGTSKPSLYKPGAEKLRFVYGLGVELETIERTVDLDRPFVDYSYRCTIKSKQGQVLSQCEGNCNSLEPKFGYVWKTLKELPEGADITNLQSKTTGKKISEFTFSLEKREQSGQYGKPAEYWKMWDDAIVSGKAKKTVKKTKNGNQLDAWEIDEAVTIYRVLNPDVVGIKNTIMKMAQKRAFVGAILLATGASEFFTQDVEDMEINGTIYSNEHPIEDAVIINTDDVKPDPAKHITTPDPKPAVIAQSWYNKLDKCETIADVDKLAVDNKPTVEANPELYQLFLKRRKELKSNPQ